LTFFPHSEKDIAEMLAATGKKKLEDLTSSIPDKFKSRDIASGEGMTEPEIESFFTAIAGRNRKYDSVFLGAGAYDHYIPAAVGEITGRQEFYTAYTPYQAEVSQGTLQGIFEYQTYAAEITGMDVSNASMYDGATACAEAIVMAVSTTRQKKVLVDGCLHPEYLEVIGTYARPAGIEVVIFDGDPFKFDAGAFKNKWSAGFAAYVVASPNFCGSIMDYAEIVEIVHSDKRLLIHAVHEAMSLSILKSPGEMGADIACGEMQSFGIPLGFGGPYLGFLSCKKEHLRKMPGRIVGQTKDSAGNTVYTLTLTAREQHIRRELAASNICSNHGLCAMMSSVYMSTLGATGIRSCGLSNIERAHSLREKIASVRGFGVMDGQVFFNEFTVKTSIGREKITGVLEDAGILSFYPLSGISEKLKDCYLVCATEKNTAEEIEKFVEVLRSIK
jgi:glycine dehydrogenase subunit 1